MTPTGASPTGADPPDTVPQAAPQRRIARFRREVDAAVASALGGDAYILGPAVEAFERAFAARAGLAHCVGSPPAPTPSPSPCAPSASDPATR